MHTNEPYSVRDSDESTGSESQAGDTVETTQGTTQTKLVNKLYGEPLASDSRRLQLVRLIERLYRQIRHGCQNPNCAIPTCLTCRRRQSGNTPLRLPTPLTARAIAAFLVTLDDPYAHVCSSQPSNITEPWDLAFPTSRTLEAIYKKARESYPPGTSSEASLAAQPNLEVSQHAWKVTEIDDALDLLGHDRDDRRRSSFFKRLNRYPDSRVTSRIDMKSLTQMLFNSSAWKLARLADVFPEGFASRTSEKGKVLPDNLKKTTLWRALDGVRPSKATDGLQSPGRLLSWLKPNKEACVSWEVCFGLLSQTSSVPDTPFPFNVYPMSVLDYCEFFDLIFREDGDPLDVLWAFYKVIEGAYLTQKVITTNQDADGGLCAVLSKQTLCSFAEDRRAAKLICMALAAIVARTIPDGLWSPSAWDTFVYLKIRGRFIPSVDELSYISRRKAIDLAEAYQDEIVGSVLRRVLRVFASRAYKTTPANQSFPAMCQSAKERRHSSNFTDDIVNFLSCGKAHSHYGKIILEWARVILHQGWDAKAEFAWTSDVGCAIEFMQLLYENRKDIGLEPGDFEMPYLFKRMDFLEMSTAWLANEPRPGMGHLLSYPWIFPRSAIVTFFRAINYTAMFNAFGTSVTMSTMVIRMSSIAGVAQRQLMDRLTTSMISFLVLEISRKNILQDALNQLWRRQKRELYRPLKVRMGMDEGEEGVDLGGVQQEFFRLALAQALDPSAGLFVVDEVTRMTWFRPRSPAPLHQFVLIGLLVGLGLYNGITMPVTFPLALYRKILGWPIKGLEGIEDGWPMLTKGLRTLLEWKDGDVEDVFMRSYVFSIDSYGKTYEVNMRSKTKDALAPPTEGPATIEGEQTEEEEEGEEPEMVTNANRQDYVDDYVYWMTEGSVRGQLDAFLSGFYQPLRKRSLELFTPEALRDLIEGSKQDIEAEGLERTAKYENGFSPWHPTIQDFWRIVRDFSPDNLRRLLEFVTASDRVPVRGMEDVTFVIQRNGSDDSRLPTSMTCFGRLLLPEYSSKGQMERKLRLAIENSRGFGVA